MPLRFSEFPRPCRLGRHLGQHNENITRLVGRSPKEIDNFVGLRVLLKGLGLDRFQSKAPSGELRRSADDKKIDVHSPSSGRLEKIQACWKTPAGLDTPPRLSATSRTPTNARSPCGIGPLILEYRKRTEWMDPSPLPETPLTGQDVNSNHPTM